MLIKIRSTLLLVLLISCARVYSQDDDFEDGVSIEEETPDSQSSNEVAYTSPVTSNKNSVYLAEHFDDSNTYHKKWVHSKAKKDGIAEEISKYDGEWKLEASQKDPLPGDMGLVLKSKAKHAAISAKLDKTFVFKANPLIVQYEVMFQDGQECGGAYLKLLTDGIENSDLKQFHDKSPYTIMFGPDKCGNDHKLHFIFRHKNPLNGSLEEKHCKKPKERLDDIFKDKIPHLYTLIIQPDNSFEVWVDKKIINSGNLLEDFTPSVNPEREIDDPNDVKPGDWDEREKIPDPQAMKPDDWDEEQPPTITDPEAVKPDGWLDDEEPMIPDPEAKRPDDWDTDMDGEWEAPLIDNPLCKTEVGCGKWEAPTVANPAYRGKWRAPLIDNPNYKGKWRPRRIPNPEFYEDLHPFKMQSISAIGFELWSMSSDILFDNLIITDDVSVANEWSAQTFELKRKKIERDAASFWGRLMVQMNHKPGWWLIYFIYCAVPIVSYFIYLKKFADEESVIQRILLYADEYPLLWILYVIGVGFPIVLIVYCCCKTSDKEDKEEERETYDTAQAATIKKTDEYTKDDQEKSDEDENLIEEETHDNEEEEAVDEPSSSGDVPRKRKVRKE